MEIANNRSYRQRGLLACARAPRALTARQIKQSPGGIRPCTIRRWYSITFTWEPQSKATVG